MNQVNTKLDEIKALLASTVADGADVTQGTKADAAATVGDVTPFSVVALLKGLYNLLSIGSTNRVNVKSGHKSVAVSQTRPNDTNAYSINDVVGDGTNMTFANVSAVAGCGIIINRASLRVDVNSVPSGMSGFKLYLFDAAPTAIADNAAFNLIAADRGKLVGIISFDTPVDLGDTLYIGAMNLGLNLTLANASTSLYGVLTTNTAYTPSAQTIKTCKIHCLEV